MRAVPTTLSIKTSRCHEYGETMLHDHRQSPNTSPRLSSGLTMRLHWPRMDIFSADPDLMHASNKRSFVPVKQAKETNYCLMSCLGKWSIDSVAVRLRKTFRAPRDG